MSDIAALYEVTVEEIVALNPDIDPEFIQPGQVLLIPAPTPQAEGLSAAEAGGSAATSGGFVVHVVRSGETLSSIAKEYDISVSVIQAANDLSPDDETIRAEQSLVIPLNTPTPSPTPTADPNVTPTAISSYASPALLYPPDGAVLDRAPVLLQWASVSVLKSDEWYQLSLWQPSNDVVSATVQTRATAWRVPSDLLQRADAPTFRWRVQVVRETREQTYEDAGIPSATYSLTWQGATTPSADVTLTP